MQDHAARLVGLDGLVVTDCNGLASSATRGSRCSRALLGFGGSGSPGATRLAAVRAEPAQDHLDPIDLQAGGASGHGQAALVHAAVHVEDPDAATAEEVVMGVGARVVEDLAAGAADVARDAQALEEVERGVDRWRREAGPRGRPCPIRIKRPSRFVEPPRSRAPSGAAAAPGSRRAWGGAIRRSGAAPQKRLGRCAVGGAGRPRASY
jgi:hypothetical protein